MNELFIGRSFADFLFGFGALFAIINPYGLAFVFLERTVGLSERERASVAFRVAEGIDADDRERAAGRSERVEQFTCRSENSALSKSSSIRECAAGRLSSLQAGPQPLLAIALEISCLGFTGPCRPIARFPLSQGMGRPLQGCGERRTESRREGIISAGSKTPENFSTERRTQAFFSLNLMATPISGWDCTRSSTHIVPPYRSTSIRER